MQAKNHIGMRAGPLLTNIGFSVAETGYWKAAVVISAAAFMIMMLVTQFGRGAKLEKRVEVAFSRARQLLHEADRENRNVRPSPLSLAKVLYMPDTRELNERIGSSLSAGRTAKEGEKQGERYATAHYYWC